MNKQELECNDTIKIIEKPLLKEEWRNIIKISGIYKIVNKLDGKYYVGSSKNINKGSGGRWNRHVRDLNKNRHHNIFLQRAWNKHGKKNFYFIFVEDVEPIVKTLLSIEQKYLDIGKTEPNKCYNLNFQARGGEWNEYTRKKMSKIRTGEGNPMFGKAHTKETIQKMKMAQCGEKHSMFGTHPSEKTTEKMKTAHLGEKNHFFGKTHSRETIDKIRAAHAKLSKENVLYIKNYPKHRGSGIELSRKFNISTPQISAIRNNKGWINISS